MAEWTEEAMKYSFSKAMSWDEYLAKKPDGYATVVGFGKQRYKTRTGEMKEGYVFKFREMGGVKFWPAGGAMVDGLIPFLEKKFGDVAGIDAALKADPMYWKLLPMGRTQENKPVRMYRMYKEPPEDFYGEKLEGAGDEVSKLRGGI